MSHLVSLLSLHLSPIILLVNCFIQGEREFQLSVAYRLRDGWTVQAETWWDDQGHAGERPREGIFCIR